MCTVMANLHFVSYEMSLVTLSLLFLSRVLTMATFGNSKAIKNKVLLVCVGCWFVLVLIASIYAYFIQIGSLKLKNNMCILFSMSHGQALHLFDYIFYVIFLICNTVLAAILLFSGLGIYKKVKMSDKCISKMSGSQHASRSRRTMSNLKIRLGLLLSLNLISMVPVNVIMILTLAGLGVDDTWQQWVVVLVVPICSVTNPLVYNLVAINMFWEKKKRLKS